MIDAPIDEPTIVTSWTLSLMVSISHAATQTKGGVELCMHLHMAADAKQGAMSVTRMKARRGFEPTCSCSVCSMSLRSAANRKTWYPCAHVALTGDAYQSMPKALAF